jgi:hypothetical protein
MSARLIKETRELLVILIGTLLLIVVPFLLNGASAAPFGVVAFGLGCAVLGGCSFGNEFQHRTLALLLSQPISRSALWRDKMLILGAGIVTSLAALLVCQQVYCPVADRETAVVLPLIALCAFCGVPYWTLVYRQAILGMAPAAGFPVLVVGVYALLKWVSTGKEVGLSSVAILLVLYCAAVFWRGHARFRQLEVFDSTAPDLSLPVRLEAVLARPLAKVSSRFRGPIASLLKKELRLQQVSFLLAGVFCLIAVMGFCVLPLYRGLGQGILGGDYGVFLVLLPLVAGAMAVAEERGWGLSEWHLTLPPSTFQQWSAKMLAVLPTSVVLGLLLPATMFLVGEPLLRGNGPGAAIPPVNVLGGFVLGQLLLASVAVYAASFSKTTMRAILAAFAILIADCWISGLTASWGIRTVEPLFLPTLLPRGHFVMPVLYASLLLLLCLTQWFAWSNFRRSGAPTRRLLVQLVVLLFAVAVGSMAVYTGLHLAQFPVQALQFTP